MTVQRFLNRKDLNPVLSNLVTLSGLPLAGLELGGEVALDSTGTQTTCFGAWRETKHGESRNRHWLKVHSIVGTRTHVVIRAIVTSENSGDSPRFEPLLRWSTGAVFHPRAVVGHKGYLSKSNYRLAGYFGLAAYIPFKSNSRNRVRGESSPAAWRRAFYLFQAERARFDATYHRRSNVGSVFSAPKRKFGEEVRSRNYTVQVSEILGTLIAYNLGALVHGMFEHEIAPSFTFRKPPNVDKGRAGSGFDAHEPGEETT
jgi:hypothetical protein